MQPFKAPPESKPEEKPFFETDLGKRLGWLPTADHLAMIAATLAQSTNDKPDSLTDAAMTIWLSARKRIFQAADHLEIYEQDLQLDVDGSVAEFNRDWEANNLDEIRVSTDERAYPLSRDDFFRMILPKMKSRPAEVAQLAKKFLRDDLSKRHKKEPTQDEVNAVYSGWKTYKTFEQAYAAEKYFLGWHKQHIQQQRSNAGSASAAKQKAARESQKAATKKS